MGKKMDYDKMIDDSIKFKQWQKKHFEELKESFYFWHEGDFDLFCLKQWRKKENV